MFLKKGVEVAICTLTALSLDKLRVTETVSREGRTLICVKFKEALTRDCYGRVMDYLISLERECDVDIMLVIGGPDSEEIR